MTRLRNTKLRWVGSSENFVSIKLVYISKDVQHLEDVGHLVLTLVNSRNITKVIYSPL